MSNGHCMRGVWALGGGALLCWGTSAYAYELDWHAPAGCMDMESASAAIERLIGSNFRQSARATVRLERRNPNEWLAIVDVGGATRVLEGDSCRSVAEAATVIVAMAIDAHAHRQPGSGLDRPTDSATDAAEPGAESPPAARGGHRGPQPNNDNRPAPVQVSARDSPVLEAPTASDASAWGWGASLGFIGEYGILPKPSAGGAVRLRGGSPRYFAETALLGLLPRDATLGTSPSQGAELYWLAWQLNGCTLAPGTWSACLGFEVGKITGAGFGVRNPSSGSGLWLAPGAQAVFRRQLAKQLHFEAGVAGFVALLRPVFELEDLGLVHQPGPISARLELGISWGQ